MTPNSTSTTSSSVTTTAGGTHGPVAPDLVERAAPVRLDIPTMVVAKVLFVILVFGLGVIVLRQLTGLMVQFSIALFLAIAADPVVRRLERGGMGRGRAIAVVMLAAFACIGGALAIFVPPLVQQGDRLVTNAGPIMDDVRQSHLLHQLDQRFHLVDKASEQAAKLPKVVGNQIGTVVAAVIAGAFGLISIFFLTLFLLAGGGEAARGIVQVFPKLVERRWWVIIQGAYTGISAYVGGAIIIALLGGGSVALMAFALGLPYALPLGLWMMLLEIIPMVGASIGAVPAIIVAFVSGGVVPGIVMVVFILVYQQLENILIQPRVQGRAASLSPLVIFLSVLIGSQLLGVLGALFAVPVAGVIHIFIRQIVELRDENEIALPALLSGEPVTQEEIAADGPTELEDEDSESSEPGDGSGSGRNLATE